MLVTTFAGAVGSPRATWRRLALAAGVLVVVLGAPLTGRGLDPVAWVAVTLGAVLAAGGGSRPGRWVLDRVGGVVAALGVGLLVLGTGGVDSTFQDLFALVLAYSAIAMPWRRLALDASVVTAVGLGVGLVDGGDGAYYGDLGTDVVVWVVLAVFAGHLSRRLARMTARQREDAALVAAADTAMVTTAADGTVRSWNPAAERLYGVAGAAAVGRPVAAVVGAADDDPVLGRHGHATVPDLHLQYGTVHRGSDGRRLDVEVTSWPLVGDDDGATVGLLVRDIGSHRAAAAALRAEQERFRVLAEQALGVVYRVEMEPEQRLTYLSPRIADLLGLDPVAVEADPWEVLSRIHPDDGLPFDPSDGSGRFDEGVHVYRVQHADGSWVWIEDHHRPERDRHGCMVASQGILHDVSARKQLEQARERALHDAQETARQLELTSLAQSVFLRSVSHQLRTPMTIVRGFAATLRRQEAALDEATRELLLDRLLHGIDRLGEHLSDLLDMQVGEEEAEQYVREPVELGAVCFEALAAVDTSAHRVRLGAAQSTVVGDRRQLVRAVAALLRNAVQHTPAGTEVHVELLEERDCARLVVRDGGPGIDVEIMDRVFEPFVQGHAAATAPSPGSGIGLTLVRQVALRHGGAVTCTSTRSGGARFDLVLPLERGREHASRE